MKQSNEWYTQKSHILNIFLVNDFIIIVFRVSDMPKVTHQVMGSVLVQTPLPEHSLNLRICCFT